MQCLSKWFCCRGGSRREIKMAASKINTYIFTGTKTPEGLMCAIENALVSENMETQRAAHTANSAIIQARSIGGKYKQLIGMDKAITVRLNWDGRKVTMEIGNGKWIDKGAALAVSMIVLWPLAITSLSGMYMQGKLPGKIREAAERYMYA